MFQSPRKEAFYSFLVYHCSATESEIDPSTSSLNISKAVPVFRLLLVQTIEIIFTVTGLKSWLVTQLLKPFHKEKFHPSSQLLPTNSAVFWESPPILKWLKSSLLLWLLYFGFHQQTIWKVLYEAYQIQLILEKVEVFLYEFYWSKESLLPSK